MLSPQMERAGQESPEKATWGTRAATIARVGARYGFDYVLGRRLFPRFRKLDPETIGPRLRMSFEELGPNFVELGSFLSARRDLVPPGITDELRRTDAAVKPMPPAEVRALVERELGNTLERLFVEFGETPVRTGVFTESHRAVLPGGRPALVVVARPGVRRDLLAMRPVADVVRRRFGERLPLNPSTTVSEYAAHVAHRRDLYFAAQTARRLAGMEDSRDGSGEGSGLVVPRTYRDYSTGRCATFEAPPAPEPVGSGFYKTVAGRVIRLGLREGIFFADLSPERFAAAGGEVWLSDPTEVFTLDPERLRGVAEVLAAVGRGDVDALARVLPLTGASTPEQAVDFKRELRSTLGSLGGPLWREHSLAEVRDRGMEAARQGRVRLPVEIDLLFDALAEAEVLGGLDEPGDRSAYRGLEPAVEAAEDLIAAYRDPVYLASRTARRLAQPDAYADYPRQIHAVLNELRDGEVEVRFRHQGLNELISKVDILANRLVFAILISALIVGSSLLGVFSETGIRLLGVNIFGLVGFLFAAILGLALLVGIIRSGRL